ncbi:MAG: UDP-glucose dehydrogenase family protein [Flavobacteriales bacterium]
MNIAVIGTGYVGLVTGTCLADAGNKVSCVDIDAAKVEALSLGVCPIFEPNLAVLLERNLNAKHLQFTTSIEEGIADAEVIFLALPTPSGADGQADLAAVLSVAKNLGPLLTRYTVIVDKSTVPVGTAERVKQAIGECTNVPFSVVSNPEFLREGFAVADFLKPDRIIVGTSDQQAIEVMESLYEPFLGPGNSLLVMDEKSAELTKYAANAFLATKITFMNEIANFCELVGANVDQVRLGLGTDERIGNRFLFPGMGYGGSCFPKDVKALLFQGEQERHSFEILQAVEKVNQKQRTILLPKIKQFFNDQLSGRTLAIWGLSFKPDTDDIREASALYLIDSLLALGVTLRVYDPEAQENVKARFGELLSYCQDPFDAVSGSDALVICTEWSMFQCPDYKQLKALLKQPVIFDGRNVLDVEETKEHGFTYFSIGR